VAWNEEQQPKTPEELRQSMLAEIESSKQAMTSLSDEELEESPEPVSERLSKG
jgi:hypothetical protein